MTKEEAIVNVSSIFNRGSSNDEDTEYFKDLSHDDLLKQLQVYVQDSIKLIGYIKVNRTQALNDHGVDMIIEFPNGTKVGIQVKSHFDVTEDKFAAKVKTQMAESLFHGVDKWYLLICSPLKDKNGNYEAKINHLINELSGYKTSYHAIYSPQQSYNILTKGVLPETEFNSIKSQSFIEPFDSKLLLEKIKSDKDVTSYFAMAETTNDIKAATGNLYSDYLGLTTEEERIVTKKSLNNLQQVLGKLTKKTRSFLFICIERSVKEIRGGKQIITLCKDLENYLKISPEEIKREVAILTAHRIADIEDVHEDGNWYVTVSRIDPDYHILSDLKAFCEKTGKPLKDIMVNLNFSHLD